MDARSSELPHLPYPPRLGALATRSVSQANHLEDTGNSSDDSPPTPLNVLHMPPDLIPAVPPAIAAYGPPTHSVSSAEFTQLGNGHKAEQEAEVEEDRKREREHKKRSKNWTRLETLKLITARAELDERFRKTGRKNALWDEISQALQRANFSRDAQQCKDKWEKLTAGYKEVRDGMRNKEDHPFFEELHQLLHWKDYKREGMPLTNTLEAKRVKFDDVCDRLPPCKEEDAACLAGNGSAAVELDDDYAEEGSPSSPRKRKRSSEHLGFPDLAVIQGLLETVITQQQRFFKELLDAVERKEQIRERMRHEREEKWRAEERADRNAFHQHMVFLTQRLRGERPGPIPTALVPTVVPPPSDVLVSPKKRSKNWKRGEVMHLIKLRREMNVRFTKSSRRAALWDELGEKLMSLGVKRDGKQCREKWDKLMAEYKDVTDGKKDREESPYFTELSTILGRGGEVEGNDIPDIPSDGAKEEYRLADS